MAGKSWRDGEMRDGIRKVANKRASKRDGKSVFSFKVPYRTADGKQTSETFASLKAAKAFRDKIRSNTAMGVMVDMGRGKVSVSAYATAWLNTAESVKRDNTAAAYRNHIRNHLIPALGGKQLRAVTSQDIQDMINTLTRTRAPRTAHLIYKTTVAVFRRAHLVDKIIGDTPCRGIELPEIPDRPVAVLTLAKVHAIAATMPAHLRAAVLLAAGTGLRLSEVLGLTWDRVDLDGATVTVDRQMGRHGQLTRPKTKRSRRSVPMPDMVAAALRRHLATFPPVPQHLDHADGDAIQDARLVFARPDGNPATSNHLRWAFTRARTLVGLGTQVTFHVLRHTFASLMIAAGTTSLALQEWMGHGSIKTTMDIYGHLFPNEYDRARAAINTAFGSGDGTGSGTDHPAAS